jgi:hypothetical protein
VARADEQLETVPLGEELEALARHYHHLQVEHQNAQPESTFRRRLEERVLDVRSRFDRLLEEWVPDDEVRAAWRQYLDHHGPRPEEPAAIAPRVFLGRNDLSGATIDVRKAHDAHEVWADGVLTDRVEAEKDLADTEPGLRFRWNNQDFAELFAASEEARQALADFLDAPDESPPWGYAQELLADGLIDVHFALRPRGRRALSL